MPMLLTNALTHLFLEGVLVNQAPQLFLLDSLSNDGSHLVNKVQIVCINFDFRTEVSSLWIELEG